MCIGWGTTKDMVVRQDLRRNFKQKLPDSYVRQTNHRRWFCLTKQLSHPSASRQGSCPPHSLQNFIHRVCQVLWLCLKRDHLLPCMGSNCLQSVYWSWNGCFACGNPLPHLTNLPATTFLILLPTGLSVSPGRWHRHSYFWPTSSSVSNPTTFINPSKDKRWLSGRDFLEIHGASGHNLRAQFE